MAARVQYTVSPTAVVLTLVGIVAAVIAFSTGALLAHLITALTLAFVAIAGLLATRALAEVRVTRAVQATAYDGDDIEVHFEVTNASRGARALVEVSNYFYTSLGPSGRVSALLPEIAAGVSVSAKAEVSDVRRGEHVFPPPLLSSGDPFGLVNVTRQADEADTPTARLTVFPRPFSIDYLAIASNLSWSIAGMEPTNNAGASGDFLGTREYRPGDSVRAIHWPLTARMGDLIVKEFERNASTEVSIFVDLDASASWGSGRDHTLEYAVRIAASVSEYSSRRGNAVQLVAHGIQWHVIPPGKGAYHQQMVMHYLAAFQPIGSTPFNYVISQMAPRLKEGASAVIIFPSEHLQLDLFGPALEGLWNRRIRVTAIIMNVESFVHRGKTAPSADMRAAAYLASRGASVYFVSCGGELSRQLSAPI
jgi:uncharacterized protein (DUF58 family)